MPLYDYRCEQCGHELEVLQGINDAPLKVCPVCGTSALVKKISAPAFTFKGGGWYKDLYSTPGSGKDGAKAESKTAASGSESKTAASPSSESKSTTGGGKAKD